LTDLKLQLFKDWHGTGQLEPDEELFTDPISIVGVGNNYEANELEPDSNGIYWVRNVKVGGVYSLALQTDKFRYVSLSKKAYSNIKDYQLKVETKEPSLSLGLMVGYLTPPFDEETYIQAYVDIGYQSAEYPYPLRDWSGETHTYKGHPGTDFIRDTGVPVLCTSPGPIAGAANGWPNNPDFTNVSYFNNNGNFVVIANLDGTFTAYHHLNDITVPESGLGSGVFGWVERGQVIGHVGHTGVMCAGCSEEITVPHLHLQIWNDVGFLYGEVDALDPYRDLYYGMHGNSPWSNPRSLWSDDDVLHWASSV
jgi:murein DD-endopeptidase MepM/ murein hydrolase activator NlpD